MTEVESASELGSGELLELGPAEGIAVSVSVLVSVNEPTVPESSGSTSEIGAI